MGVTEVSSNRIVPEVAVDEASSNRVVPEVSATPEKTLGSSPGKVSIATTSPGSFAPSLTSEAQWQWYWSKIGFEGQEEWRNYDEQNNEQMEEIFQTGSMHMRIKSGKNRDTPMEIFFGDLVQYDPLTGNTRNIRRLGPDGLITKMKRRISGYLLAVASGKSRHKSFIKYKKEMGLRNREKKHKPVRSEFCSRIVSTGSFIVIQMLVIVLNTIVIGFDVEHNTPEASASTRAVFDVIDHAFCMFFTVEIIIRWGAMKKQNSSRKAFYKILKDRWMTFDGILVLFMLLETWFLPFWYYILGTGQSESGLDHMSTLRLLRLLRLSRVGRIARLLQFFPEILMMVKSIFAAMRAVLCTFAMLLCMLYLFAIIYKARAEGTPVEYMFPSIPGAMWMLLLNGAFMEEIGSTVEALYAEDGFLAACFLLFIFLSNLTVLNMLIGVICEVANQVSEREREMNSAKMLKQDLMEFVECFDMDGDHTISVNEFELLLGNPDVKSMLARHEVDFNILVSIKDAIFQDKDAMAVAKVEALDSSTTFGMSEKDEVPIIWRSLSYDELIQIILRFRGGRGNSATVLDIMGLERNLSSQIWQLESVTKNSSSITRKSIWKSVGSPSNAKDANSGGLANVAQGVLPKTNVVEGDPVPRKMSWATDVPDVDEGHCDQTQIELTPLTPEGDLQAQMNALASQQATFVAEMREQIKWLVVGQREISTTQAHLGQLVRDHIARNPGKKDDAVEAASDEWGSTQMHKGRFEKVTPKTAG